MIRLAPLWALGLVVGCGNGHVDGPASGGAAGSSTGAAGQSSTGAAGDAAGQGAAGAGGDPTGSAGASTGAAGTPSAGTTGNAGATGAAGASAGATGAAGAAGATGGSATGAAGAAADAGAACNGLVCEDFEKLAVGAMPGAPFKIQTSKGSTVLVDDTRAHGGTHSVKVSIPATTASDTYREAYLAVTGAPLLPLPGNHVYGRFMLYTDRIPDKTVHWTIAHGDGPYMTNTATYNYGGMGGLMANYYRDTTPPNDCWQTKNSTFPTGRWVCVAFEFDGPGNAMRFSLDGADVPEVDVAGLAKTDKTCTVAGVDGRWLAPTAFKNIKIGWESYQHDVMGAHDAWLDDLELDTHPVTCP